MTFKLETMYAILKYNYRKEVHLGNKDNKHYYISTNHIRAGAAVFLWSRLQGWWLFLNDSYCVFHFRAPRIRTHCTFLCATLKNSMFKRSILVLNCLFLPWHPLVGALVQCICLCWVLCNRHLGNKKTWQLVLEALCMLSRRPAGYFASNCTGNSNWWGLKGLGRGSRDFVNISSF